MNLIVRNKRIDAPMETILKTLRAELRNGKLRDILPENHDNISVTCPVHKDGLERNPSCFVYSKMDHAKIEYGKVHCFTCGYTATLPQFVTTCFGANDYSFGEEWLIERFGTENSENIHLLPEIEIGKKKNKKVYLDESVLDSHNFYNEYMWKRHISKEVVDKFKIGFDPKTQMLSFPVWDEYGKLSLITYRSVKDKRFFIEEDKDKPVYLLNFLKDSGITTAYVVESQINALTLWSWGYPAIALIGTGSEAQYNILNRCHLRNYILCLDGDEAGDKGIKRFIKNIRKDVLVSVKNIPRGKDVNDLTKDEFDKLSVN